QKTEAAVGVAVLNRMLAAGRPNSVRSQKVPALMIGVGVLFTSTFKCTNAAIYSPWVWYRWK
ncbi:hypothetical protein AAKU64_003927, partial [Undibacterium sp. GrIS 1.8]